MQIIKEKPFSSPDESLKFFKDHFLEFGGIRYIVLYYAEREWLLNNSYYHQYVIVVGNLAQLWLSGLSWGYFGSGPHALFELIQIIDLNVTYDKVIMETEALNKGEKRGKDIYEND